MSVIVVTYDKQFCDFAAVKEKKSSTSGEKQSRSFSFGGRASS